MDAVSLDIWQVLLGGVFFMVWLIRLEAKVLYLEKDWQKLDAMQVKLQEIAEALARLEGKLEHKD